MPSTDGVDFVGYPRVSAPMCEGKEERIEKQRKDKRDTVCEDLHNHQTKHVRVAPLSRLGHSVPARVQELPYHSVEDVLMRVYK
jgi:hypothetical protein